MQLMLYVRLTNILKLSLWSDLPRDWSKKTWHPDGFATAPSIVSPQRMESNLLIWEVNKKHSNSQHVKVSILSMPYRFLENLWAILQPPLTNSCCSFHLWQLTVIICEGNTIWNTSTRKFLSLKVLSLSPSRRFILKTNMFIYRTEKRLTKNWSFLNDLTDRSKKTGSLCYGR